MNAYTIKDARVSKSFESLWINKNCIQSIQSYYEAN